jgi:hypothetical protein
MMRLDEGGGGDAGSCPSEKAERSRRPFRRPRARQRSSKKTGGEVALDHCPVRKQSRLYLADDPVIFHLRPASGAAAAQPAPDQGAAGKSGPCEPSSPTHLLERIRRCTCQAVTTNHRGGRRALPPAMPTPPLADDASDSEAAYAFAMLSMRLKRYGGRFAASGKALIHRTLSSLASIAWSTATTLGTSSAGSPNDNPSWMAASTVIGVKPDSGGGQPRLGGCARATEGTARLMRHPTAKAAINLLVLDKVSTPLPPCLLYGPSTYGRVVA